MKGSFKKSTLFMLVFVLALSTLLAACGKSKEEAGQGGKGEEGKTAAAEFRFTIASDPPSLDPALMKDSTSGIVAAGLYEGLTRLNAEGFPEAAVAKDWTVSEDGLTYTFNLRDDVKWSNGDSVTAHDFEYAWKRVIDPATPADYAYKMNYIVNAEAYNAGEIKDADQVGIKATGDYTLEVKLHSPTPYFPSIVAFYTFSPVHKATVEASEGWAAEQKTIVSNGPFLLKQWAHEDKLVLEKNPDYYATDKIGFDKVTLTIVNDENTIFNLYETNKIDWIGAQAGALSIDRTPKMIEEGKATVHNVGSVYYYEFNHQKAPFDNAKIRKAFAMSIDRQSLIDNVTKAKQTPAFGIVPPNIAGADDKTYRDMYADDFFQENVEEAKKLLEEGLKEKGLTELPEITLLYNTSEGHKKLAEAMVDMWRKNLGVEVKLANQEWGTFLEAKKAGQFDIARSGWGADNNHPNSFVVDLLHPNSGNNDGKYINEEVGKLLDESLTLPDMKASLDLVAQAEKIAFEQDMAVLPVYYYTTVTMLKDGFKGVGPDYSGTIDWVFGSKE
ncbi:peptide ABC transporter substrate-binding protein [Paenibacillus sp. J5C_2022]|uniref:peptide ABC transporter substrate-binding protein n=1 Tax=Paenibacillus sp. J5C2022 TaxID=2977129 RepID=UPI0021D31C6C|nr:peptide ABC transporter substrate-binding protein [Paenibacillus sp. J5C2022]MCU6708518.1 peptide ABC transporter substrate-binding protein [Paenibacillus sp. J5C2022]